MHFRRRVSQSIFYANMGGNDLLFVKIGGAEKTEFLFCFVRHQYFLSGFFKSKRFLLTVVFSMDETTTKDKSERERVKEINEEGARTLELEK